MSLWLALFYTLWPVIGCYLFALNRYKDEDFDDSTMVAGFADIMKEEVRRWVDALAIDIINVDVDEVTVALWEVVITFLM